MVNFPSNNLKIITVNLHKQDIEIIGKFIEYGIAASRSDYVRQAVRAQIKEDYKYIKKTDKLTAGVYDHTNFVLVPGKDKPFRILRRLE